MDMQIDSWKIRFERERRAWSQEHLAAVSGLSLRTVQRVESSGSPHRSRYVGLAASLVVALGLFFIRTTNAGEVALDVEVMLNHEKVGQQQLVAEEGKSSEIKLEGKLRVFVNPIVTKTGAILLSMRVEEPAGGGWKEIQEPRIMVENGSQGTVKVTSPKGSIIEIAIRPRRM